MRASAYAKLNLALAVFPPSADGYHPLAGIFQSISLADEVAIRGASEDAVTVSNDEAPSDTSNLAFRALDAARRMARITVPLQIDITKRIPAGAGLGGGSADAAATLGLMADRYRLDQDDVLDVAGSLGADVPFAYVGGTCSVRGRGERLTPMPDLTGFAVAVVVPPFALSTVEVFRRWDELGGPEGPTLADRSLPPALRNDAPIRNDLFPAAASIDNRIAEWRDELQRMWGVGVAMTGSGSALFAYFSSMDEATAAADVVDLPVRLAVAAEPIPVGWEPIHAD